MIERNGNGERVLKVRVPVAIGSALLLAVLSGASVSVLNLREAGAQQQVINAQTERRIDRLERQWEEIQMSLNSLASNQREIQTILRERLPAPR